AAIRDLHSFPTRRSSDLLMQSGMEVFERLVEFPLWEEYDEQIQSDMADITNLGGPLGGAITAGKFLEHFIDFHWIHIDIAGPSLDRKSTRLNSSHVKISY